MTKKWISLFFALLGVLCLSLSAWAHPVPDLSADGSVHITLSVNGHKLEGGSLQFHRVGEIAEDDGNFSFRPAGAFASYGESFGDVRSAEEAKALLSFAKAHKIPGISIPVQDGAVHFPVQAEALGLYLVSQKTGCKGYAPLEPFLIAVPNLEEGVYVYDVEADPKIGTVVPPPKPLPPDLPDTGQKNWPIAALTCLGLLLLLSGLVISVRGKQAHEA